MLRLAAGRLTALSCRAPALLRPALAPQAVRRPCMPLSNVVLRATSRCCSGAAASGDGGKKEEAPSQPVQVYEGAKNKVVTTIKKVSIGNLAFAILSTPLLQYITAATGSPGKGVAMSSLVRAAGTFITARARAWTRATACRPCTGPVLALPTLGSLSFPRRCAALLP